jgi:phosphate transport system protein
MTSEHIVKSYDAELNHLNETILKMGGLAESQLAEAIKAIATRDPELAMDTVQCDPAIDALEAEVDHQAVRLLALRQPMAKDLRNILAALKISSAIERIGDYAANVAKRAATLAEFHPVRPTGAIPRMGRLVQRMIKDVLDAYTEGNADKAKAVWARDHEVDELYNSLFREVLTYMMEDPRNIGPCTHLLFVAKNIERIGDHTTNMAEIIYFMVTGNTLLESRPKGEDASFAHPEPPQKDGGDGR